MSWFTRSKPGKHSAARRGKPTASRGSSRTPSRRRSKPAKPRSRWQRFLIRYGWILPVGSILIGGGILLVTYAFASLPLPEDIEIPSSAEVYDRKGRLIGTYSDEVRRFLIDTDDLPKYIGQAVVASEDKGFYEHNGISPRGIVRAAWTDIMGGEVRQGGSTITQQYVKNAVLEDPARTISRKFKEAILAIKLERRFSKQEILGFYLNTIYLGRGAYGIEAAARTYFDKHAEDLTLAEAAFFAGIIPAPESYQPDEDQKSARAQRDRVLRAMESEGYISAAEADKASRGRVKLGEGEGSAPRDQRAAYFLEWLRKDFLYPEFGRCLYTCGLKIYTTLDLDMQQQAEVAIETTLTEPTDPQAALVSMTPSGEVRAFVGGKAFTNVKKARGFNYASDLPGRQAGSAFKPFTLVTAIEEGISTDSRFSGASPRTIEDPACAGPDGEWDVENYAGSSFGTIDLDEATTNSVNTVYAQLVSEIGPDKVAEVVADFEFDRSGTEGRRKIPEVCSLSLGVLDVTPVEMTRAYAGFAARGALPETTPIRYIKDATGDCIRAYLPQRDLRCDKESKARKAQIVDQNSADVLNQTLTHVVEGGTATSAAIGRPVAGKTGTTQNNVDAWFAGYVPQLTTVVWMGYPAEKRDGGELVVPQMGYCSDLELCRPVHGIEVTGGSFPAEIWAAFMSEATADMDILAFVEPADLPDTVINSPAPAPVVPVESDEPEPEPVATETVEATPSAAPSESVAPTSGPTAEPSPTNGSSGDP